MSAHTASRSVVIARDAAAIYELVRDFAKAPAWRSDIKRVEILSATRFREHSKHGAVTYDVIADEPPHRLVTRIADTNLGYSGSWTYALEPVDGGTRVTITENGEVTNLFFRIMSKLFFGHTATIERTLTALQRALL